MSLKALQDVKKMRRAIRLREENDPLAVSKILDTILNEAIVLKQMSDGFVGKGAVKELRNIRRDLIAGNINAGAKTAEYISKYSMVIEQIDDLDKEEKNEVKKNKKSDLMDLLPRKDTLISAAMTANPMLGYGLKLATTAFGGGDSRNQKKVINANKREKLKGLKDQLHGKENKLVARQKELESSDIMEDEQKGDDLRQEKSDVQSRLDLIREEIAHLNDLIEHQGLEKLERVQDSTESTNDSLQRLNETEQKNLVLDMDNTKRQRAIDHEKRFEGRDEGAFFQALADGEYSDGQGEGGGKSSLLGQAGSGIMDGITGGAIARMSMAGAAALVGKIALVGVIVAAVLYYLWKNRDTLLDFLKEKTKNFYERWIKPFFDGLKPEDQVGLVPNTEQIKESVDDAAERQGNIIEAADQDPQVVAARNRLEDAEQNKEQLEKALRLFKDENDRLVEKSDRERKENGVMSQETIDAIKRNSEAQERTKAQINSLEGEIKKLTDSLRKTTVERRKHYRDNFSEQELDEMVDSGDYTNQGSRLERQPKGNAAMNEDGVSDLMDTIGQLESKGNYNALVYGRKGTNTPKEADLTDMTIREVQEYQSGMIGRGHASTAVGKYQFVKDTLRETVSQTEGIDMDSKFSPEVQEQLGRQLLEKRKLGDYISGEISLEDFAHNLSKEWASLPSSAENFSYYKGVNGNKAGMKWGPFMSKMEDAFVESGNPSPIGEQNVEDSLRSVVESTAPQDERPRVELIPKKLTDEDKKQENKWLEENGYDVEEYGYPNVTRLEPNDYTNPSPISDMANERLQSFEQRNGEQVASTGKSKSGTPIVSNKNTTVNNNRIDSRPKDSINRDPTWRRHTWMNAYMA